MFSCFPISLIRPHASTPIGFTVAIIRQCNTERHHTAKVMAQIPYDRRERRLFATAHAHNTSSICGRCLSAFRIEVRRARPVTAAEHAQQITGNRETRLDIRWQCDSEDQPAECTTICIRQVNQAAHLNDDIEETQSFVPVHARERSKARADYWPEKWREFQKISRTSWHHRAIRSLSTIQAPLMTDYESWLPAQFELTIHDTNWF